MSQANFTPISLYYSTTASAVPTAANLVPGELAINTNDGKLYYEDSSGVVQVLATKSTGSIGGSNTQVQFNNSGSLGGSSGLTWDGSFLTTSSIKNSALTSGRVTYAGASGLLTDSANLLYSGTDLTVYGLTVGRGAGAVVTNNAFGVSALSGSNTGANNTAIGWEALKVNTSGAQNVAVGRSALAANTTGAGNNAIGVGALLVNTSGSNNTALGSDALVSNTTASNNTAVGYQAAYSGTTATELVAVGKGALYANTVNYGTAVGFNALNANTTGAANAAFGAYALSTNTTGAGNSAFGGFGFGLSDSALQANTTGSYNSAFGLGALKSNTTASNNTAVGYQAGYTNTTGARNTFFGMYAGYSTSSGGDNTFIGYAAGHNTAGGTGTTNICIGYNSGSSLTSGSKNVIIGGYLGGSAPISATGSNYIVLSDGDGNVRQTIDSNGNVLVGQTSISTTTAGIALQKSQGTNIWAMNIAGAASTSSSYAHYVYSTTASAYRFLVDYAGTISATSIVITAISDERLKENIKDIDTGLDSIMALKPRRFDWKKGKGQDKKNAAGFIAQEFETVFPECVGLSQAGGDGIEYKNINHETLIPTLVKAIQELKAEIDAYKATHP